MEALVVRFSLRKGILFATLMGSVACTKQVVGTEIAPAPDSKVTQQLDKPLEPGQIGGNSPRSAVVAFMTAVKAQDLRGMSAMWGNDQGPTANRIKRDELEKRLIVIQNRLSHDKWSFAEDNARLATGGRQEFIVNMEKREATSRTMFTTVAGPGGRYFVEDIAIADIKQATR
jgi:hypothetical protein